MADCRFGATVSRSVVGIMNEFTRLGGFDRERDPERDLLDLTLDLATTPCGPLYRRHISPDRELAATLASITV